MNKKAQIKNGDDDGEKKKITGKKEAIAVCIMYLVSSELNLEIKIDRIVKVFDKSNRPNSDDIRTAKNSLRKHFKDWF